MWSTGWWPESEAAVFSVINCCWFAFPVRRGGCVGFLCRRAEVLGVGLLSSHHASWEDWFPVFHPSAKGAVEEVRGRLLRWAHLCESKVSAATAESPLRWLSRHILVGLGLLNWGVSHTSAGTAGNPHKPMCSELFPLALWVRVWSLRASVTGGVWSGRKPASAHCIWPQVSPEVRSSCSFCILRWWAWCW